MINKSNKWLFLMAVVLSALCGMQGFKAFKVLSEKARLQADVTESVDRWKQNYKALGDTVKRWNSDYRRQESVDDLMTLVGLVRFGEYGLTFNADNLILNKILPVTQSDAQIGLTKVCLATNGTGTMEVQASSYQALFNGLNKLALRPDIYIERISVRGDMAVPVASLGEFCVLLSK